MAACALPSAVVSMVDSTNREWVFKSRPKTQGVEASDFELRPCATPEPQEGELLVALHLLSMDPTLRNAMAGSQAAERTDGSQYYAYMNWHPGSVPSWMVVAQVLASKAEGFERGDMVMGMAPVVGVPLPLLSYGGSATLVIMLSFGLVQSAIVHRLR